MDLECTSKAQIGLIGSMIFIGWTTSAVILPRMADIYGRKPIILFSLTLQFLTMGATFFSNSALLATVIMFFLGFSCVGRCSISFLFLMELLPYKKTTFYGTIVHMSNGLLTVVFVIYFLYISRNWKYIEIFALGLTVVCFLGVLLLPESPKFLVSKSKWGEARRALSQIAKINGRDVFTGKFDREKISAKQLNQR